MGHTQIPGQHRFVGSGVQYRRIAVAGAADGVVVVVVDDVAAAGGTAGSFPAETGGATTKPRVTGGFHGCQNEV